MTWKEFIIFLLSRIFGNIGIVFLAYLVPNLVVFISLVGCICSTAIGFIFPVLFYFKVGWKSSSR